MHLLRKWVRLLVEKRCAPILSKDLLIIFIHDHHTSYIHDTYARASHHTGSQEDLPYSEIEENLQEEPQPEVSQEEGEEELPECPDHRASDFVQGKHRSIYLPMLSNSPIMLYDCCIKYRSCVTPLLHYILALPLIILPWYTLLV